MVNSELLNGRLFSFDEDNNIKLQMEFRNWNDWGFYTLYSLKMYLPCAKFPYYLAGVNVMYIGQCRGETTFRKDKEPLLFIPRIEDAERMFLMLTPSQRKNLESLLSIQYDCNMVYNEPVFIESVIRGMTIQEFIQNQKTIKYLIQSDIDAKTMLLTHRSQINSFLADSK